MYLVLSIHRATYSYKDKNIKMKQNLKFSSHQHRGSTSLLYDTRELNFVHKCIAKTHIFLWCVA